MKKFLLKLLMGSSLTASVFLFQACYGCPPEIIEMPRNQTQAALPEVEEETTETLEMQEPDEEPEILEQD
ncbi:MAG: hypothetical protein IKR44_01450 [Bacteroidales bacterium]|nr:hypothetical protein [Bacteroidales bacterium]